MIGFDHFAIPSFTLDTMDSLRPGRQLHSYSFYTKRIIAGLRILVNQVHCVRQKVVFLYLCGIVGIKLQVCGKNSHILFVAA